ncbi:hypothetical protein TNCV_2087411 [Trichonephila clavipes]|nr:hypothetical protein TNCV_2087411 [Trichonephila clavipes]
MPNLKKDQPSDIMPRDRVPGSIARCSRGRLFGQGPFHTSQLVPHVIEETGIRGLILKRNGSLQGTRYCTPQALVLPTQLKGKRGSYSLHTQSTEKAFYCFFGFNHKTEGSSCERNSLHT